MAETKETKKIEIEEKVVPQTRENYLVIGMSLGMSLGVAVGAMVGVGLGLVLTVMRKKHDREDKETKKEA